MVTANKNLLKEARKIAIRDELLAMRLRGRLVAPQVVNLSGNQPAKQPGSSRG